MKLFLTFALAASCCAFAQQTELTKTLAALDTALFDSYNKCQLDKFEAFFDDKVEFYHDQSGVTSGKKALSESLKKNICGKVIRELVPGTMQVHEMKNFGALQMGVHLFRHPGPRGGGWRGPRAIYPLMAVEGWRLENCPGD